MSTEQMQNTNNGENVTAEADVSTERYLTFRADGITLGVSTENVIEIITDHSITWFPILSRELST